MYKLIGLNVMSGKIRVWRTCCLKVWGGILKKKNITTRLFYLQTVSEPTGGCKNVPFYIFDISWCPALGRNDVMRMRASYKNVNRHLPMAKFGISWVRTGTTTYSGVNQNVTT